MTTVDISTLNIGFADEADFDIKPDTVEINGQTTNLTGDLDDIWFESIVTESKQCNACNQFVNAGHKMFSQDNTLLCEVCFLRGFAARTLRRLADSQVYRREANSARDILKDIQDQIEATGLEMPDGAGPGSMVKSLISRNKNNKKKLESAEHKLESMREFNKSALETISERDEEIKKLSFFGASGYDLNRAAKQAATLASQRSPENNLLACDPTEPIEYEIPAGYQLVVDRPQPSTLSPGEIVKNKFEKLKVEAKLKLDQLLNEKRELDEVEKQLISAGISFGCVIEPRFHCEDCRRQAERLRGIK